MNYFIFSNKQRDGKNFPDKFIKILNELGENSGEKNMIITSYLRKPEDQTRIMLELTTKQLCDMYKNPARRYCSLKKEYDKSVLELDKLFLIESDKKHIKKVFRNSLFEDMLKEVKKGYFDHIKGDAIDIAPSSIKNKSKFELLLNKFKKDKKIDTWLGPRNSDPAYHIVKK